MTDVIGRPRPYSTPSPPPTAVYRPVRSRMEPTGKRLDIQGLRMLAVVAVFVNHVSGHPRGAFTGVDVFFVISGFLITGLLVRDAGRGTSTGRYFAGFYKRRARRILPAALATLAASYVAATLTFSGTRLAQARSDIWWSLGFSANVHYARIGTDYFSQGRAPSITQHFWSLAVEEQFYVVWPVVVLVVLGVLGRRGRRSLDLLLALIVVLTVASFVYSLYDSSHSPTTAYFSTFARAWELGVGAVLAIVQVRFPRWTDRLGRGRGPVAMLGVLVIVASYVVVDPGSGFPAPAGALPVFGAAVVLAAAAHGRWAWPLTNRVSVYIGEISYSLYLWHWPVIIIASALVSQGSGTYYAMVVPASLALAVFSFEFVETPFRTRAQNDFEGEPRARSTTAIIAAALAVTAATAFALAPNPAVPNFDTAYATPGTPTASSDAAPASAELSRSIASALQATSFPALTPNIDSLGLASAESQWAPCEGDGSVRSSCVFPSTTFQASRAKTVVVLGDSIALSYLPAIRAALEPHGYKIFGLALQQCAAALIDENSFGTNTVDAGCTAQHRLYARIASSLRPGIVVLASAAESVSYVHGLSGEAAVQAYRAGLIKTEQLFSGAKIVNLAPPPTIPSLTDCASATSGPQKCVGSPAANWFDFQDVNAGVANQLHTTYVDTRPWTCSATGYCPSFIGANPVFWDGIHLTDTYAETLAPEMYKVLTSA